VTRVNSQARFLLDEINEKALEQTNFRSLLQKHEVIDDFIGYEIPSSMLCPYVSCFRMILLIRFIRYVCEIKRVKRYIVCHRIISIKRIIW